MSSLALVKEHMKRLAACALCPEMGKPVVTGRPVVSPVLLVGQAPGDKEPVLGKPFAWTAGKRLFQWTASIGLDEERFRARVYMAAVCRCFPGKKLHRGKPAGDREPSPDEVAACAKWLDREIAINRPRLVIPIGRMAIEALCGKLPLVEAVGAKLRAERAGVRFDAIPLPHPSGASTWYYQEPGKALTRRALKLIAKHEAWREIAE